MSGTGSLSKLGAGTLTLTGASALSGATLVSGGGLTVLGSLASGVSLAAGTTLAGRGAVGGVSAAAGRPSRPAIKMAPSPSTAATSTRPVRPFAYWPMPPASRAGSR